MGFIQGVLYNFRGLKMGLMSGRLLFWGMIRFVLIIVITIVLAVAVLSYRVELTQMLWTKPGSAWVLWLWHVLSWVVSMILLAFSAILSFIVSQLLFSSIIMDHMSKITELRITGEVGDGKQKGLWTLLLHLTKQEIPRLLVPLLLSLLILAFGWVTPFGPLTTIFSAALTAVFLSWDNTDLVPARRMIPFRERFRSLLGSIPFHVGFGLPFLVPGLNLLFLSFAPVGATLYYIDRQSRGRQKSREMPVRSPSKQSPAEREKRSEGSL